MAASEKIRNGIMTAWIKNELPSQGMEDRRDNQDDRQSDTILQYRKYSDVGRVACFELAGLAIKHGSDPLDDPFAEQALRAKQKKNEGNDVREPGLDAASHQRTPVEFTELFTDSDNQPSDNGTGDEGQPSQNEYWEAP